MFPGPGAGGQCLKPPARPAQGTGSGWGTKSASADGEEGNKKAEELKQIQLCFYLQEGTQPSHLHAHAVQGTLGELWRQKHVPVSTQ